MTGAVSVVGLKDFSRELDRLGNGWPSALSLTHQKIASLGARASRARALAMGGVQGKAASAIGERHSVTSAAVAVLPSRLDRMANVAFWGAKKRTGWYAARRYAHSTRQHPSWVGNTWEAAVAGQGPYAINAALAAELQRFLGLYGQMIDDLAHRAFPER